MCRSDFNKSLEKIQKTRKRQHGIHSSTDFQDLKTTKKKQTWETKWHSFFCLFTKKTRVVLKTVCQNSKVFSLKLFLGRFLEKKGLMVHYSEKSYFILMRNPCEVSPLKNVWIFIFTLYKVYL